MIIAKNKEYTLRKDKNIFKLYRRKEEILAWVEGSLPLAGFEQLFKKNIRVTRSNLRCL